MVKGQLGDSQFDGDVERSGLNQNTDEHLTSEEEDAGGRDDT